MEKEAILNSYKLFLKTCNFDIQIIIQSNKEDISKNINKIRDNSIKESEKIKLLVEEYCKFIKKINLETKSSSKKFYILINKNLKNNKNENIENIREELNSDFLKIKECLSRCGNTVYEINKKEDVIEILNSFLNKKQYLNKII